MEDVTLEAGIKELQDVKELHKLKQKIEILQSEEIQLLQAGTDEKALKNVRAELKRVKQEHEDLEFKILEMLVSDGHGDEEGSDQEGEEEDIITPTNCANNDIPDSSTIREENFPVNATISSQASGSAQQTTDSLDTRQSIPKSESSPTDIFFNTKTVPFNTNYPVEVNSFSQLQKEQTSISVNNGREPQQFLRVTERRDQSTETSRPLTQFLPTMDPDFALDEYLLSCGHNLEQMKIKILVDRYSCSGYLLRMTSKPSRLWLWPGKRYWVSFDRQAQTLYLLRHSQSKKPKEVIPFNQIQDVFIDRSSPFATVSPKRTNNITLVFCVQTNSKAFHFLAPDEDTLRVWVQALFTGAEAYLSSVIVEHKQL